jgi:hypothetical protein
MIRASVAGLVAGGGASDAAPRGLGGSGEALDLASCGRSRPSPGRSAPRSDGQGGSGCARPAVAGRAGGSIRPGARAGGAAAGLVGSNDLADRRVEKAKAAAVGGS